MSQAYHIESTRLELNKLIESVLRARVEETHNNMELMDSNNIVKIEVE